LTGGKDGLRRGNPRVRAWISGDRYHDVAGSASTKRADGLSALSGSDFLEFRRRLHPLPEIIPAGYGDQCLMGLNFDTLRPRRDILSDYEQMLLIAPLLAREPAAVTLVS
jgi:hypothetical protein